MPFAIVKLPNEPIAIVMGDVPLEQHIQPLRAAFAQVDRLATDAGEPLYCVIDTQNLTTLSFSDILIWLDEQRSAPAGSVRDPRLRVYIAGTHDLLPIAVKKVRQQFGVDLPIFPTLDEALAVIRARIQAARP